MLKKILILFSFFFILLPLEKNFIYARSADYKVQKMSLDEFIERVSSHPVQKMTEAEISIRKSDVQQSFLWKNPSFTYSRDEVFDGSKGIPENNFLIEFPLEISGKRSLEHKGEKEALNAVIKEQSFRKIVFLNNALTIFYKTAALEEKLKRLKWSDNNLNKLYQLIQSKVKEGYASSFDLARTGLEINESRLEVENLSHQLFKYRLLIGEIAGEPGESYSVSFDFFKNIPEKESVSGVLETMHHPEISAAEHNILSFEKKLAASKRGWVPELIIYGGFKTVDTDKSTLLGYSFGLNISLPFFNYGQTEKNRFKAQIDKSVAEKKMIENKRETAIKLAFESFMFARKQFDYFKEKNEPLLQSFIKQNERLLYEGEKSIYEVIDSSKVIKQHRLMEVDLVLQVYLSKNEFEKATAKIYEEDKNEKE